MEEISLAFLLTTPKYKIDIQVVEGYNESNIELHEKNYCSIYTHHKKLLKNACCNCVNGNVYLANGNFRMCLSVLTKQMVRLNQRRNHYEKTKNGSPYVSCYL